MVKEVSRLRQELAELRVMVDAHDGLQAAMESRAQSAVLARDQAIADRAKWEGLFTMINATLRAFEVPAAPLIVEARPTAASVSGDGQREQQFVGAVDGARAAGLARPPSHVGLAAMVLAAAGVAEPGIVERQHAALDGLDDQIIGQLGM